MVRYGDVPGYSILRNDRYTQKNTGALDMADYSPVAEKFMTSVRTHEYSYEKKCARVRT